MKQFRRNIKDIEASGYSIAAEVLLIGLKHIKEHNFSYPPDLTPEQWQGVVDELIWFCEFHTDEAQQGWLKTDQEKERYNKSSELLGRYFKDIWC